MSYEILKRYQYWSRDGLSWSAWFVPYSTGIYCSKAEAMARVKELQHESRNVLKATKEKAEFQVKECVN